MSEVKVDLEGMRKRAAEAKAYARAWGETEHGSDDEGVAGAQLEAAAIKTAGDVLTLCAEVERLRELDDLNEKIIGSYQPIFDAEPCPAHGPCVPHIVETLGKRKFTIDRWRPVIDAAKQWFATLAKSDMSPHAAREALARAVIALGSD